MEFSLTRLSPPPLLFGRNYGKVWKILNILWSQKVVYFEIKCIFFKYEIEIPDPPAPIMENSNQILGNFQKL